MEILHMAPTAVRFLDALEREDSNLETEVHLLNVHSADPAWVKPEEAAPAT